MGSIIGSSVGVGVDVDGFFWVGLRSDEMELRRFVERDKASGVERSRLSTWVPSAVEKLRLRLWSGSGSIRCGWGEWIWLAEDNRVEV